MKKSKGNNAMSALRKAIEQQLDLDKALNQLEFNGDNLQKALLDIAGNINHYLQNVRDTHHSNQVSIMTLRSMFTQLKKRQRELKTSEQRAENLYRVKVRQEGAKNGLDYKLV